MKRLGVPSADSAIRSPLLALALIAVFAGTALATDPNSGFVGTPLSRGTLSEPVHFNTGAVKFQTKGSVDVATATVAIAVGGSSGWHTHPGIVLVTVKAGGGSVTFYDQTCAPTVHPAGTTFVEADGDGPGLARNESAIAAVVYVTYIVPTGAALRNDVPVAPCVLP